MINKYHTKEAKLEELVNKVLTRITNDNNIEIVFVAEDETWALCHSQDCCESVRVEDISGDLNDLIGVPILLAEEVSNNDHSSYPSTTWTFYKFRTIKGDVTIRWIGESNGYYSEEVDFVKLKD